MNEKTKIEIDKLNAAFDKTLAKNTPATLTDVCRLIEMSTLTQMTILHQLTEIRELLEKNDETVD